MDIHVASRARVRLASFAQAEVIVLQKGAADIVMTDFRGEPEANRSNKVWHYGTLSATQVTTSNS